MLIPVTMNIDQVLLTDQMIIQETITNEANYFAQGDYENWAACMVQTSLTYYSRPASLDEQQSAIEAFGWAEIAQIIRKEMSSLSETGSYPHTKSNFQFNIMEDMAFVNFFVNGHREGSCVLEKVDGQWFILRMSL